MNIVGPNTHLVLVIHEKSSSLSEENEDIFWPKDDTQTNGETFVEQSKTFKC